MSAGDAGRLVERPAPWIPHESNGDRDYPYCDICGTGWPCMVSGWMEYAERLELALEQAERDVESAERHITALECHRDGLILRAETAERRAAELAKERDRLATDALIALAGAHVGTPVEGYVEAPWCLKGDIERLAKERDEARRAKEARYLKDCKTVILLGNRLCRALIWAWRFRREVRRLEDVAAMVQVAEDGHLEHCSCAQSVSLLSAALLDRQAAPHPALTTPPICGNTGLTEAVEERFRAIRAELGHSQEGGCGKQLGWLHAYRCLDCGRFMHADCLRQHFEAHGDLLATAEHKRDRARQQRDQAEHQRAAALAALGKYGTHLPECDIAAEDWRCTCGLGLALSGELPGFETEGAK